MKQRIVKIIDNAERVVCTISVQQEFIMGKGFVLTIEPYKGCFTPTKNSLIYEDDEVENQIIRAYRECNEPIKIERKIKLIRQMKRRLKNEDRNQKS